MDEVKADGFPRWAAEDLKIDQVPQDRAPNQDANPAIVFGRAVSDIKENLLLQRTKSDNIAQHNMSGVYVIRRGGDIIIVRPATF